MDARWPFVPHSIEWLVKQEPGAGAGGVSEAAARAGLYAGHEVKDELVLGPYTIQRPHNTYAVLHPKLEVKPEPSYEVVTRKHGLRECSVLLHRIRVALVTNTLRREDTDCNQPIDGADVVEHRNTTVENYGDDASTVAAAAPCVLGSQQPMKDCSVRLERLPSDCANPSTPPRTAHTNSYMCDTCSRTFTRKLSIIRHIRLNRCDSNSELRCATCSQSGLFRHTQTNDISGGICKNSMRLSIHTLEKPYYCRICKKKFTQSRYLTRHRRIHTGDKPHSCEICNKKFFYPSRLTIHKRIHTGDKPYSCDICNKQFAHAYSLTIHKRIHTGNKPHSCEICQRQFSSSSILITHRRIHTGEKPYSCEMCKMQFTSKTNLTTHKTNHTGNKSYSCESCNKKFTFASSLTEHKRIHTGDKPYSCDICNKNFTRTNILTAHRRTHTGEKPYACNICNKKFTQASHLTVHRRIHSGIKPYSCEICDKKFTYACSLTKHRRSHDRINKI